MITEEMLQMCRSLRKESKYIFDRILELDSQLYSITSPSLEPSYGGGNEDSMTNLIANRDKLREELVDKQIEMLDAEYVVERAIIPLPVEERMVIRLYYIKGYDSWDDVATEMNYSPSQIYVFRHNAIKRLKGDES